MQLLCMGGQAPNVLTLLHSTTQSVRAPLQGSIATTKNQY